MSLVEDFRNSKLSIEEILNKYQLTFKEAFDICLMNFRNNYGDYKYIYKTKDDNYSINKTVNKQSMYYGTYKNLEDAIKARDKLLSVDWDINRLNKWDKNVVIDYELRKKYNHYTLWDYHKVLYRADYNPETTKAFCLKYNTKYLPAGMFIDFVSCEIIHDLIKEYMIS